LGSILLKIGASSKPGAIQRARFARNRAAMQGGFLADVLGYLQKIQPSRTPEFEMQRRMGF
ncbi:MAG: hypothetical protein QM527_15830, partial [Alphaproteobacteria bacterium]|nr:hypothetical protein [Alphaproteobacteria bacterium]